MLKIVFFILLMFPFFVYALEDEGINNYFINAVVVENGDIIVQEYFEVVGEYNGYYREINYRNNNLYPFRPELEWYGPSNIVNGNGIVLNEIRAVNKTNNFNFDKVGGTRFEQVDEADVGDYGVYTVEYGLNGNKYQIFLPSSKNKAFYLEYRLKNMGILYNDVAEFWWPLPIDEIPDDINKLKVDISLKKKSELFRVWAHGPLDGTVQPINNSTLRAEVKNVGTYENDISLRMVFDRSYLESSYKKYDTIAFPKILAYEEEQANQANYEREQENYATLLLAKEEYRECDLDPNMSCYNELVELISTLETSDDKDELLGKLPDLRIRAMAYEEKEAKSEVYYAASSLDYNSYEDALEQVNILDDSELKDTLLADLEIIREAIYKKEYKLNVVVLLFNIVVGIFLTIILMWVIYEKKYSYKSFFEHKYYRSLPRISPADVSYLINNRKISNDAISAELLLLIIKKYITVEKVGKKDFLFKKLVDIKGINSAKEKNLMKLLFDNKEEVLLSEFKNRAKKNSYTFYQNWRSVDSSCITHAKDKDFYIQKDHKGHVGTALSVLGVLLMCLPIGIVVYPIVYVVLFILFLINVCKYKDEFKIIRSLADFVGFNIILVMGGMLVSSVYFSNFVQFGLISWIVVFILFIVTYVKVVNRDPYTDKGKIAYGKLMAFKNFLNDFSIMDERELPDVKLWEKYLAYAVVLKCADKVESVMQVKFNEMDIDTDVTDVFTDITFRTYFYKTVSKTISNTRTYGSSYGGSSGSNRSSGSGFGGGFSSGGGFSGGGGSFGGGGRF